MTSSSHHMCVCVCVYAEIHTLLYTATPEHGSHEKAAFRHGILVVYRSHAGIQCAYILQVHVKCV